MADYTSLATVKTIMNITGSDKDTRINALIPMVTSLFNTAWQRDLRLAEFVENYDGSGSSLLRLNNWPLVVETGKELTIKVDTVEVDSSKYKVDKPAGLVILEETLTYTLQPAPVWEVGVRNVEATYYAGYSDTDADADNIPQDIVLAASLMVGYLLDNAGSIAGGLVSERIGNYSYRKAEPDSKQASAAQQAIPPNIWGMIASEIRQDPYALRRDP